MQGHGDPARQGHRDLKTWDVGLWDMRGLKNVGHTCRDSSGPESPSPKS